MENKHAIVGVDLHTTAWCTISSMLYRIARETRHSNNDYKHICKGYYGDRKFIEYLTFNSNSPLRSSLKKAGKDDQEL